MSFAAKSNLDAIVNRRAKFEGEYKVHKEGFIELYGLTILANKAPTSGVYKAGTVISYSSSTLLKMEDRAVLVGYPEGAYDLGLVSGPLFISKTPGELEPVKFKVLLTEEATLEELLDIGNIKLFVEGR